MNQKEAIRELRETNPNLYEELKHLLKVPGQFTPKTFPTRILSLVSEDKIIEEATKGIDAFLFTVLDDKDKQEYGDYEASYRYLLCKSLLVRLKKQLHIRSDAGKKQKVKTKTKKGTLAL